MSSGSFYQRYVKCPFYQSDDGKRHINCEGIVEGSRLTLRFKTKADYKLHIKTYCCERPKYCELNKMLSECYEE